MTAYQQLHLPDMTYFRKVSFLWITFLHTNIMGYPYSFAVNKMQ